MSVKNKQQLKQLNSRKSKIEAQLLDIEKTRREVQSKQTKLTNQLKIIDRDIESLTEKETIVTEHAILRYLERSSGLDFENVKNEILNDKLKSNLALLNNGNGKYPIGNNLQAVIKNNTVVTVV